MIAVWLLEPGGGGSGSLTTFSRNVRRSRIRICCCFFWLTTFLLLTTLPVQGQTVCPNGPANYSDFSAILIGDRIYVIGGNTESLDIWYLDLSQGLDTACPHWDTTATPVQADSQIILSYTDGVAFPGSDNVICVQAGDGGTQEMDNVVLYNISSNSWSQAPIKSSSLRPQSRAQMSATTNRSTGLTWFYGGRATHENELAGSRVYYNDFYQFDTNDYTWTWPKVQYAWGQRPARYGHTANLIMGQLFVLGGMTAIINGSDDQWMTSAADFQSVLVFDTLENKAVTMATIGDIPDALFGFSATLAPDGKSLVIFGGQNLTATTTFQATQSVYLLDTCTMQWSQPEIGGIPPSARAGHQSITYGNYMIVLMGYTNDDPISGRTYTNDVGILDMSNWQWVNSMPARQDNIGIDPGCRFSMPHMPGDDGGGDGNGFPYDPTVISNPNRAERMLSKALGISFGILGSLLCVGALVFCVLRRRTDTSSAALSKSKPQGPNDTNEGLEYVDASNNYSLVDVKKTEDHAMDAASKLKAPVSAATTDTRRKSARLWHGDTAIIPSRPSHGYQRLKDV